ncbi:MAG: hypothetical protein LBS46_01410 [Dysgonamonadaceae bacterium]|jgi:hypothetical protein|nr:hypothetical protein [Dysgonamonadaceae bacterium]
MQTKILTTILILLLSVPFAKGQDYIYVSLVEEGVRWSYARVRQVGTIDLETEYSSYRLKGDTVINDVNYKKLLFGCSENYIAALREDDKKYLSRKTNRTNGFCMILI